MKIPGIVRRGAQLGVEAGEPRRRNQLLDLRGPSHAAVATTVDLLTTGVDVPCVRNVVFFKYLKSPISFYQMVGRGTRIDLPTGKLMFRIYDYTDATRLFGEEFITKPRKLREDGDPGPDPPPPEPTISVGGFEAHVTDAGWYVPVQIDGRLVTVPIEEYKAQLAAVPTPPTRRDRPAGSPNRSMARTTPGRWSCVGG